MGTIALFFGCHNQAQGHRYDKSQVQCHYYKKYGHYANECRKKQYDISNKPSVNFTNEKYGHYANECRKKKCDIRNKPSVNFKKENQNHDSMFLACNVAQEKESDI